jgi:hypothetical protein
MTNLVNRYTPTNDGAMRPDDNGGWVMWEAVAHLLQDSRSEPSSELEALRKENAVLKFQLDGLKAQQRDATARGDEAMAKIRDAMNRGAE